MYVYMPFHPLLYTMTILPHNSILQRSTYNYTQYTRRYNTLNIHTGPCTTYICRDENNCVKILENMWISVADVKTISDVSSLSCWCRTKLCRDGPIAHPSPAAHFFHAERGGGDEKW